MSISIRRYLALTAAEFGTAAKLPEGAAWMACHFSCYATGLSNLPSGLPKGSMIIVNDRTPICGHDPETILQQLKDLTHRFQPDGFLLDLQRPDSPETATLVRALVDGLDCPVGVSEQYAQDLACPVFLPPPPLYQPLVQYLKPWQDREIWLEAATGTEILTLTDSGCQRESKPHPPAQPCTFAEDTLCCRYRIDLTDTAAVFTLHRDASDLAALLNNAEALGVTRAIGLYQQLGDFV